MHKRFIEGLEIEGIPFFVSLQLFVFNTSFSLTHTHTHESEEKLSDFCYPLHGLSIVCLCALFIAVKVISAV